MRTRRNAVVAAVGLSVVLTAGIGVTGCVQSGPAVIPTSEPSSTPVFSSNAAALAAAKKAFTKYLAISDAVAHDGGTNVQRLAQVDSASQLKDDSEAFARMRAAGRHTTGESEFSDAALESSAVVNHKARVVAYICMQIGGTQLLDSSGANVGANRSLAVPLEVSFMSDAAESKTLLVDRSAGWSGKNFCS